MDLKDVNWRGGMFLIVYHILFFVSFPLYAVYVGFDWRMLGVMFALICACGLGITTCYHRYYSHKTFQTNSVVEAIILFFGTLATQGSALEWSHDHRLHHRFVDTDKDPYSIKKGFWHAHFLWMLKARKEIDHKVVPDLVKNRLVMLQHRYYVWWLIITNGAFIAFFGWLFGDVFGALVLLFLTRLFVTHHSTWFINSLAHTWGKRPYDKSQTARDNWFAAVLTWGEGYHNYHHTFASDYRNGVRWWQWDPTKYLIWTMSKLGLARNLKYVNKYTIKMKSVAETKRLMLERIKNTDRYHYYEQKVHQVYESLNKKYAELKSMMREYQKLRVKKNAEHEVLTLRQKLKHAKAQIELDWQNWNKLTREVKSASDLA